MNIIGILISLLGLPFLVSLCLEIYFLYRFKWYIPFILCAIIGLGANIFTTILFVASINDVYGFIFIVFTLYGLALLLSVGLGLIASWVFPNTIYSSLARKLGYISLFTLIPLIGFFGTVLAFVIIVSLINLITYGRIS